MPEYLAPGVFIEEVSYRAKSIEGVSTTTTGFIGPTRYGPTDVEPDIVTSLVEYERVYGDRQPLEFGDPAVPMDNFMWHAARAFFENGGKRLYVQRTFNPGAASGFASAPIGVGSDGLVVRSRFPGRAGTRRVRITLALGPNVLALEPVPGAPGTTRNVVRGLQDRDVVWISQAAPVPPAPRTGEFYLATSAAGPAGLEWTFGNDDAVPPALGLGDLAADVDPAVSAQVRVVTATVTVMPTEDDGLTQVWGALALDPGHRSFGSPDSLLYQFDPTPDNIAWRRSIPIVIAAATDPSDIGDGLELLRVLLGRTAAGVLTGASPTALEDALRALGTAVEQRSTALLLDGGDDGDRPTASEYEGNPASIDDKSGLKAFEDLEDISIVAAPGSTFGYEDDYRADAATIIQLLISHAERMRYRIAVLDSGDLQDISQVRAMRARLDSKHAAIYYPWVRVLDPVSQQEIHLPPSGFVAGIFARNDVERAVYKAPANEVVTLALGFERTLNKAQQEVLNPEGVNCLRFFEGRGNRLWGARTISSDPEWKYVNLRRYFAYLERSIDVGTQWAVFEPNGPSLWANVRRTISDFLLNEFMTGAFVGDKPEKSYFVKCDRSTMTQNDLDNGRLVCHVGVAVVKPAEFVIFRIGQWTADAKN
ncbi:MAG: phage tail sheath subtilisin-like domain-containing protein [Gemmatimonadaceae bacterium]|jgi:phage tail sheath protein FI|nr:phage tail sheath subtilisin-like domain-containing protein [Gemmatimonadaceae bacterium]